MAVTVEVSPPDGGVEVAGRVHLAEETREVWARFDAAAPPPGSAADGLLAAALFPAMLEGEDLDVPAEVSARLLRGVEVIQEIFSTWYPVLRPVAVRPAPGGGAEPGAHPPARGVGAFFSGGVDSFYTLLEHRAEITALVFVRGFDIPVEEQALGDRAAALVRGVAEAMGKELIEVRTNVRRLADERRLRWGEHYHGACLAAVAHFLAGHLRRVYVPATDEYNHLTRWGSHPLVDPRWSSEAMEIVHDGCARTRLGKIRRLASSDVALGALRVCWQNEEALNCGRCEKCFQTMAALAAVTETERAVTFPRFDPAAIEEMSLGTVWWYEHEENLAALRARGDRPEHARAVARVLERLHATLER